jgi:hypothetical protein
MCALLAVLFVVSVYLSFFDFRRQEVPFWLVCFYVLNCFLVNHSFCPWPALIFFIVGIVTYIAKRRRTLGSADYLVVVGSCFIVHEYWPAFIAICGAFGLATSYFFPQTNTDKFPFIPSILGATFLIRWLEGMCTN